MIADGHPMGIAYPRSQEPVAQAPAQGPLGIDHPLRSLRAGQKLSESLAFAKRIPKSRRSATCLPSNAFCKDSRNRTSEQAGQDPNRQKEPRLAANPSLAVRRESAAGNDAMQMWVV